MHGKRIDRRRLRALAFLILAAFTGWAHAGAWLCRDEKGTSSYQDSPCPERKSSGIKPVKANEVDEKAMRETLRRMGQAQAQRDAPAYLAFYSRSLKGTWQDLKGAKGKSNYEALENTVNVVFDAAVVAETLTCKVVAGSSQQVGALQCLAAGSAVIAGRTIKGEQEQTFEFGIENGEVKIVATKTIQTRATETTR